MSAAAERVREWFGQGTLLAPDPDQPNAVDLARALALVAGASRQDGPGARALAARIGQAEHLVFVLVDGLGLDALQALPAERFLPRHLALELRAVFPSATASAITSLATGCWPGQHAVPGWWTHLPEHGLTAVSLPFIERFGGQPLEALGLTTAVYPQPSLLASLAREAHTLQPERIHDSAYSRYFRGQTAGTGYRDLDHACELLVERLRTASGPTYSYLYVPTLDEAAHAHGPLAEPVQAHLLALDQAFERLAGELAGRARLVLSADHGLVRVEPEGKHVLDAADPLLALLEVPPSGEPRAPLFHVRPGQQARFRALFEERFGGAWALLATDEVERLGLFGPGPLSALARSRLGDFLAVCSRAEVVLSRRDGKPSGTESMVGYHGGLLPAEMRIPLVLA